jgi:hypothetical protein
MMIKKDHSFEDWCNDLGQLSDKDEDVLNEQEKWVDESISKVYWEFRDNLSDTSGERMDEFLNGRFKMEMMKILWEEHKAFGA